MKIQEINIIFAKATCEVWKERLRDGECTFGEYMESLNKLKDKLIIV